MIVGACGFGSTGSSVITDYLSEYNNVCTLDGIEFTWVAASDGLIDLKNHVMNPHSRTSDSLTAIRRYYELMERKIPYYSKSGKLSPKYFHDSVDELIDAITTVSWYGFSHEKMGFLEGKIKISLMERRIIPWMERKKQKRLECWPMKKMDLSIRPSNFDEAAKKHVNELLKGLGADFTKMIVLDQPFPGNDPCSCFPFYEDPYAIVVDRDPRDNYVFACTRLLGRNYFMPTINVEDFIKYYRALRENQPYTIDNPRILRIQFEDMVYNYSDCTKTVREFLGLSDNPNPKSIFDPAMSISNTQTFRRFPQFQKDIEKIEAALPEYLYDFNKYPVPDLSGEMFFGKSPLHK